MIPTDPANNVWSHRQAELRRAVEDAFQARQRLQRAELAEFAERMQRTAQSIEFRDSIANQIIDRRVEDLLNPNRRWDGPLKHNQTAEPKGRRKQTLAGTSEKSRTRRFEENNESARKGRLKSAPATKGPIGEDCVTFDNDRKGLSQFNLRAHSTGPSARDSRS